MNVWLWLELGNYSYNHFYADAWVVCSYFVTDQMIVFCFYIIWKNLFVLFFMSFFFGEIGWVVSLNFFSNKNYINFTNQAKIIKSSIKILF